MNNEQYGPIHIYPVKDEAPHTLGNFCVCSPKFETYGQQILVIHNSFDGREVFKTSCPPTEQ